MNLLPLVMIILLILGVFSLSQSQRNHSLKIEQLYYVSYFEGLRSVRSQLESKAYKKFRPTNTNKKGKDKPFFFFRDALVGSPYGRLNLSSLIDGVGKESATLRNVCLRYLLALYGHTHFFPKNPQPLLEAIITHLRTNKESRLLHELQLSNPEMHTVFYKILKGTQFYNLKERIGYPPLHLFFAFETSTLPPMNFHAANETFLEVVLEKPLKDELIQKERKRAWEEHLKSKHAQEKGARERSSLTSHLSQEEIHTLLQNISKDRIDLFDFSTPPTHKKKPTAHTDCHTFVTVRTE